MRQLNTLLRHVCLVLFICTIALNANAGQRYAVNNGAWNSTNTWSATNGGPSGASIPSATDTVFMDGSYQVTVSSDGSAAAMYLTVGDKDPIMTISGGTLTVAGSFYINAVDSKIQILMNSTGALVVNGGLYMESTGGHEAKIKLEGSSQLTINGNTYLVANNHKAKIECKNTSTIYIDGNVTLTDNVGEDAEFKIKDDAVGTITGDIIFSAMAEDNAKLKLEGRAYLNLGGSMDRSALGNYGDLKMHESATMNMNGSSPQTLSLIDYGKSKDWYYGEVLINNTAGVTTDAAITKDNVLDDIRIQSGTLFHGYATELNGGHVLEIAAGTTFNTSSTDAQSGFPTTDKISLSNASTVNYSATSAQSVIDVEQAYGNVIISEAATKTLSEDIDIDLNLTIESGATLDNSSYNILLGGSWSNSGTFVGNTGTVTLDGSGTQTISTASGETFYRLAINKTTGSIADAQCNIAVTNRLTMTDGILDMNTNTLNGAAQTIMNDGEIQLAKTGVSLPEMTGNFTMNGGTLTLDGAGAQTINSWTGEAISGNYFNLTLGGSGTKSSEGDIDVNGNLTIQAGVTLDVTAQDYAITLAGSWSNSGTFIPNAGKVTFDGNGQETVYSASGNQFFNKVEINKTTSSNALTLLDSMAVNDTITFTDGHLFTYDSAMLYVADADFISGGSSASYVDGPFYTNTSAKNTVTIPVGDNEQYHPVDLTPSTNGTCDWLIQYFNQKQSMGGSVDTADIDHISGNEYWYVKRIYTGQGQGPKLKLTLTWTPESLVDANLTDLMVAGWDGSQWIDWGLSGTTGDLSNGTAQSGTIDDFTHEEFTLASPTALNDLGAFKTRYAVASGNWNLSSTWAKEAGGTPGATVPGDGEIVVIADNLAVTVTDTQECFVLRVLNGTVEPNLTVNGGHLTINDSTRLLADQGGDKKAYMYITGGGKAVMNGPVEILGETKEARIFMDGASTLEINNDINMVANGQVSKIEVYGTSTLNITGNVTLEDLSGHNVEFKVRETAVANVDGDIVFAGATAANKTKIRLQNTAQLNITGNFDRSATGNYGDMDVDNGTIVNFNGTSPQIFAITDFGANTDKWEYGTVYINNEAGVTLEDNVPDAGGNEILENLYIQTGTLYTGGYSLNMNDNKTFSLAANTLYHTTTSDAEGGMPIANGLTYLIDATSTVEFASTSNQIIPGLGVPYGNLIANEESIKELEGSIEVDGNLTIDGPTTLDAATNAADLTVAGDWPSTGTFWPGTGTVTFDGTTTQTVQNTTTGMETFYNIVNANTTSILEMGSSLDIDGSLTINNGAIVDANEYDIEIGGNWVNNNTVAGTGFTEGSGTVTFDGTSLQTITHGGGTEHFYNLQLSNTSADVRINDILDIQGWLVIRDGANLNANNFDLSVAGNWDNRNSTANAGFTEGTSTVTFDGTGNQWLSHAGDWETFYNLDIANNGKTVFVNQGTTVNNQLDFPTTGYIDISEYELVIEDWDDGDIPTLGTDRFVIVNSDGNLTVNGVGNGETVNLPIGLYPGATNYARVDVANRDNANTSFSANLCYQLNSEGTCEVGGTPFMQNVIDYTWNVTSASTDADITLYWDTKYTTHGFWVGECALFHHTGMEWEQIGEYGPATNLTGDIYYKTASTTSFSPFGGGGGGGGLPIELISFEGEQLGSKVLLEWMTATETSNDYFIVERSTDSDNFIQIDYVEGAGTSTETRYYKTFDNNPQTGVNYYRLKQVDFDGQFEYSDIIAVDFDSEGSVTTLLIYPNPVDGDQFQVKVEGLKANEHIEIMLIDMGGKTVFYEEIQADDFGAFHREMTLSNNLARGVYNLYIASGSKETVIQQKMILH